MTEGFLLTCELAAVLCALGIAFSKSAFSSVMLLLACCLCIAGIFGALQAPYMLISQIAVYGGGIVVLFLFALMIAGKQYIQLGQNWAIRGTIPPSLLLFFLLTNLPVTESANIKSYTAEQTGRLITSAYLFPFELSGVLLLVALVGAITISVQKPHSDER